MRRTTRLLGVPHEATRTVAAPYRPGARHGPPFRRRRPAVRAPAEVTVPRWNLRRHCNIADEALTYNTFAFPSRRHRIPAAPFAPSLSSCAPPSASHVQATVHTPSLDLIEPSRVACCPGQALAVAGAEPLRPPPPTLAMHPHRRLLRPNLGYPQALGERVVEPHYLPSRERLRLAGIRSEPPPHAKDPIGSPPFFPGSNPRTGGVSLRF
jgi:hypothetical protein